MAGDKQDRRSLLQMTVGQRGEHWRRHFLMPHLSCAPSICYKQFGGGGVDHRDRPTLFTMVKGMLYCKEVAKDRLYSETREHHVAVSSVLTADK